MARVRVLPGMLEVAGRERDELWELSVAKDKQRKREDLNERKREDLNALRLNYHLGQAKRLRQTMTALITVHENEAQKLLEGGA